MSHSEEEWETPSDRTQSRRYNEPSNRAPAPKLKKNCIREERIRNQIIVDAYGPAEQALAWYYYLENQIKFPFTARCIAAKVVSPLGKGETVEVRGLAPEDSCTQDIVVRIRWHNRNVARVSVGVIPMKKPESKPQPSWTDVKGKLAAFDRIALVELIHHLCAAQKDNQAFLHARFGLVVDVLEPYKRIIDRWVGLTQFATRTHQSPKRSRPSPVTRRLSAMALDSPS